MSDELFDIIMKISFATVGIAAVVFVLIMLVGWCMEVVRYVLG